MRMDKLLLVFAGGGAGAVARYLVGVGAARSSWAAWPYGTLAVNVLGGFLMGLLVAALKGDGERWRLLLGVGVLGGFTTFSAFSLETAMMIERRAYGHALGYSLVSVTLSVTALFAGLMLSRRVFA